MTLDRYEITALQKMGWKEEEIAMPYPPQAVRKVPLGSR